jgi:hypothetical protein
MRRITAKLPQAVNARVDQPLRLHRFTQKVIAADVNELTSGFARSCQFRTQILNSPFGVQPMKHTGFPPVSDASLIPLTSGPGSKALRGSMAYLTDALHASRRLQAARVIRQNRHLVHHSAGNLAARLPKRDLSR